MVAALGVTAIEVMVGPVGGGVTGVEELPPPPHAARKKQRLVATETAAHRPKFFMTQTSFLPRLFCFAPPGEMILNFDPYYTSGTSLEMGEIT
jgi:hypothetical protein